MKRLQKEVQKEIKTLEETLKFIDEFKQKAPQGCLKIQNKDRHTYFYQQYMNEGEERWDRRYIKKENISLACDLAQKHYYGVVEPIIKNNLDVLKQFIKNYRPETVWKVYDDLCQERKKLVEPLFNHREKILKHWKEEVYRKNDSFPEHLIFETDQGDMVRSKSEVIIANILYRHKGELLYKYERPLEVMVDGYKQVIYPDFTVLNIHTGKVTYWEHAGRMDDPGYANNFVKKINTYIQNNILPGKDVLFTYESQTIPLNMGVVKKMVNFLLENN